MGLFLDHVNTVLSKLRADPITALSTDTTTEAYKAQVAVRRAVWRVWNAKQWSFKLRQVSQSLTSGTNAYLLSKLIAEPTIFLVNSSPYFITGIRGEDMDRLIPSPTQTGVPQFVKLYDLGGVIAQGSGNLTIVSSDSSDTTQTICIKGSVSASANGETVIEELALNGINQVASVTAFGSPILAVSKSDRTAGYVTIKAGSTILAILGPQEKTIRYRSFVLYPIPDSAYTLTVKGFGMPPLLTHAYEDTEIPARWDYVVDQWAFALALQSKGQEQITEQSAEIQLAKIFVDEDMAREEYISSDEVLIAQKWGLGPVGSYFPQLNGYGITYND